MTDMWVALAIVAGVVVVIDLVTAQLRKRAKRTDPSLDQTQEEIRSDVQEE